MSIEIQEPAKTLIGRACGVYINKTEPLSPKVDITYTKDNGTPDGVVMTSPSELIEEAALTIGEVETLVALITKMCDAKSPFKVVEG